MNNDNPDSGQHGFSIKRLLDKLHPNPASGHSVLVVVGSAAVIALAINLALIAWALTPKETTVVFPPMKTDRGIVSAPPVDRAKHDEISGLPVITDAVTHEAHDCAYVEVAFTTPLEARDLIRYASIGLDLHDRIDSHTWYACLVGDADEFIKAHQEINRIDVIDAESKVAERLKHDREPLEHERRTGGRVAYSVLFHKDVDFQQAQSMADSMQFELENVEGGLFNTLGAATVIVPEGRILALAGVDIIARIEPIDTPEAPTNQERGQPLSNVDKVQEDPIGLDGSGVTVGVWEAGGTVLAEHLDLTGRVVIEAGQTSRKSGHATHVAGTIGSSGAHISAAEGMAPNSQITSWDARNDHSEMLLSGNSINSGEGPDPVFISNHSYGLCTGWNGCTRGWLPNDNFGAYTIHAGVLDRVIAESGVISAWSAGNSQNYGPRGNTDPERPNNCTAHQYDEYQHPSNVFADCINAENGAKNVITVAAMKGADSVASFSSYGPMDDGRIKPDLAAQGNPLLSTVPGDEGQVCVGPSENAPCASASSGTSMSAPVVAGVAALVMQDVLEHADDPFRRVATRMTPEGMKALLIQTAQDVSGFDQANPGPDYATGWGIVDAEAAITLLRKGGLIQAGLEGTGIAEAWTQPMVVPPDQTEIHVTLAWTDPPGNPAAEKALVHDLDLRLISPDGTEFTPWVLAGMADPTRPAVRNGGNDSINNVEQVSVLSPEPGDWQVVVKADPGNMPSPQKFAIAGVLPVERATMISVIRTPSSAGPARVGTPPSPSLACPMKDTEIIFNKTSETGDDLWKVNSNCEYTQITDTPSAGVENGVWSPDGKRIAFVSEQDGNQEIYVMNADGSGQTRLTFHDDPDRFPSWSPDGKKIVFTSPRIGGTRTSEIAWDIHVLEVAKPNNADNQYPPKALTQAGSSDNPRLINSYPDWSPDGDRIAFAQVRTQYPEGLYLMDTDGGNLTRVTASGHRDYMPQWSPDGKKLLFMAYKDRNNSVWVVGSDGSNPMRLTDDQSDNGSASWSHDGKQIAFSSDRDGNFELYMMDADGSNVRRITNDGATDWFPSWSPVLSETSPTPPTPGNGPDLTAIVPNTAHPRQLVSLKGETEGTRVVWDAGSSRETDVSPVAPVTKDYFQIPADASPGVHNVAIRNSSGTSTSVEVTVLAPSGEFPAPRIEDVGLRLNPSGTYILMLAAANLDADATVTVNSAQADSALISGLPISYMKDHIPATFKYPVYHYAQLAIVVPELAAGTELTLKTTNSDGKEHRYSYRLPADWKDVDSDGDGLLDRWETGTYTAPSGATIDLAAMGVDPHKKDILIEADWVEVAAPPEVVWTKLEEAFANAPVLNPDGTTGVNIIVDRGQGGAFVGGGDLLTPNHQSMSYSSRYSDRRSAWYQSPSTPAPGPTGNRIAFTAGRDGNSEIYVMDRDGSNLTNLTNNWADDWQSDWSHDGTKIAFISDRDGNFEIYVMDANGTKQTRLTNNSSGDYEPSWSPDGKQIVFYSSQDGDSEILVMNADGSNRKALTINAANDWDPDWSPDGSKIAFVSNRDGPNGIYVMESDGTKQTMITNNSANEFDPDWSPDGSQIVFTSKRDGNYEIYVMNADGSDQTNVTNNSDQDYKPSWNSDGTKITFYSKRDGNREIYVMDADGSNQTNVTNDNFSDQDPSWGPAGAPAPAPAPATTKIIFDHYHPRGADIGVMNADGTGDVEYLTTSGKDRLPAVSPDGKKIAFTSNRDGNNEIYVMNADGTSPTRLTNRGASDDHPSWSPDGKKIAFVSSAKINVIDADGNNKKVLTSQTDHFPAWSPDGEKIAFASNVGGTWGIHVINADGTGRTVLSDKDDAFPAWSPDSSKLVFISMRDGNFGLYEMNADGSDQKRLMLDEADKWMPSYSPDGTKISFAKNIGRGFANGGGNYDIHTINADGTGLDRVTDNSIQEGYVTFATHKERHFNIDRLGIFKYFVLARQSPDALGIAEFPFGGPTKGDDFWVALATWTNDPARIASVSMHELGHDLGLSHGGIWPNPNHNTSKPNFPSVMSYRYAADGISIDCNNTPDGLLTFSQGQMKDIVEPDTDENIGICDNMPLDMNNDGSITSGGIDSDGRGGVRGTHKDYDQWGNMVIDFMNR